MSSEASAVELVPIVLRELDLALDAHPHGSAWLSATSGLVCIGQQAYVIADDEHHLGHFKLDAREPVGLLRLFEGSLPRDKGKRKKAKPDLESLVLLPALDLFPHGALLALGSGSRPNRCRATLLALDEAGNVHGHPLQLDLSALYAPLHVQFGDLNIEGAFLDLSAVRSGAEGSLDLSAVRSGAEGSFVSGGQLHLLQRGNKGGASARISFDWPAFAAWLLGDNTLVPIAVRVQRLEPGSEADVPLAPTDAVALSDGRWVFCAVAEDSCDSYSDGACTASAIGIVDSKGYITRMHRLRGNPKVEGIAVEPGCDITGKELRLLLVTDADDPDLPSRLLRVSFYPDG